MKKTWYFLEVIGEVDDDEYHDGGQEGGQHLVHQPPLEYQHRLQPWRGQAIFCVFWHHPSRAFILYWYGIDSESIFVYGTLVPLSLAGKKPWKIVEDNMPRPISK